MKSIILSDLPKTWLIDIDGVIFVHNSHLTPDGDQLVEGVVELFEQILPQDTIILLTSRDAKYRLVTIKSLKKYNFRFDDLIFNLPPGERVVINDMKASGLKTAIAINTTRDNLGDITIVRDTEL